MIRRESSKTNKQTNNLRHFYLIFEFKIIYIYLNIIIKQKKYTQKKTNKWIIIKKQHIIKVINLKESKFKQNKNTIHLCLNIYFTKYALNFKKTNILNLSHTKTNNTKAKAKTKLIKL